MKLKKRLVGCEDIKARRARRPTKTFDQVYREIETMRRDLEQKVGPLDCVSRYDHIAGESPVDAHARGVGYRGPPMPDKGQKDGSCNRTACQLPLAGREQWTMRDLMVKDGKLYYCADCAMKFHEADRQFGEPLRCTLVKND